MTAFELIALIFIGAGALCVLVGMLMSSGSSVSGGYQPTTQVMPACRPPRQRTSEDCARDELERLHDFLAATIDNEWSVEQAVAFSRAQLDLVEAELKKPRIPQPQIPSR